ncbi:hypothetical protein K493DRAFT_408510 [Basidiobolus meristosporus CBS 931.73]|uniref:Coiled-coil domain-containing protein 137 n=1 Tax=Basidiobolus meristosporus CBS 931.73 TaxID=1314790 RepID=A0A1Y1Y5H6_9FUNG|nr:hypothetical protein K493DRAFT_408510 [Basidiobolus meristosporus CBS 931.73]|eukprot:ORX93145.1 hypothetical protein K493DRAFT_408510 [Basidiobolus meristosporus CBS 931.73]
MPNKRKLPKKATPQSYDQAPKKDVIPDMPRKFARLLNSEEIAKRKKEKTPAQSGKAQELTLKPRETLKEFNRRVDQEFNSEISKAGSTRKKEKRKLYKEKKILKERAKKELQWEDSHAKDFHNLEDKVKFGEIVDAPPIIKAVPKARKLFIPRQKEESDDEPQEQEKRKNKGKLRMLSAAQQRIIGAERERAIASYRALKKARMNQPAQ